MIFIKTTPKLRLNKKLELPTNQKKSQTIEHLPDILQIHSGVRDTGKTHAHESLWITWAFFELPATSKVQHIQDIFSGKAYAVHR